jgi:hypothetical protein
VFTEPLEKLLREGAADGRLRDVDPVQTATVLFNLVGWTYIHLRTGHGWRPERALRADARSGAPWAPRRASGRGGRRVSAATSETDLGAAINTSTETPALARDGTRLYSVARRARQRH